MSLQQGSIITQVSNEDSVDLLSRSLDSNPVGDIKLNLRGQVFDLKRQVLLRLPESILLGISNGLVYDPTNVGQINLNSAATANVNFSPACLQYTLDVFSRAAEELPVGSDEDAAAAAAPSAEDYLADKVSNIVDVLRKYPAIIVLREDLDFYCLPKNPDTSAEDMQALKRSCGKVLLQQNGVFAGLRKGDKADSPEHHLIDMLCSSGFTLTDEWGFRECEPNKTVVTSLALIRLQTDKGKADAIETEHEGIEGSNGSFSSAPREQDLLTSHKLLLFWRKPARKCWWDSLDLHDVEGADGPVRVHIRRVWTLELSVIDGKTVSW